MTTISTLKWRLLSLLMRTVGRAGDGILIGYRRGFDSGAMLDYVYENRASGKLLIGPLVDRVYLDAVGWRAIRARKELLKSVLRREIEQVRAEKRPVVVLDVAAGPGRYLLDLCRELAGADGEAPDAVQIICRDLDAHGLELGSRRAKELGLANVRYELGDATDPASLATVEPRPDIVVVSGLYELFTDPEPLTRSLDGIHRILPPGGRLIFTTQVAHPQLELIANVLVNRAGRPWVMVCRSLDEVAGLARQSGFRVVGSELEPLGLFSVTRGRKDSADCGP